MPRTNQTRARAMRGLGVACSKLPSKNAPRIAPNRVDGQAQQLARLRFLAKRLYALGPRPLFYFLREVERGADLRDHLEKYAALPADFIKAHGGDEFESPSLIEGGSP